VPLLRLTTPFAVATVSNIRVVLLLHERMILSQRAFAELVVWQLPSPVPGSAHRFKYRLAYVTNRRCVIQFDNESGKGDHMHVDGNQLPYVFVSLEQMQDDFWRTVRHRRRGK
jgi:Family of unknown function (DUF6516)